MNFYHLSVHVHVYVGDEFTKTLTPAVAQWVRALAPQAKGLVFESQLRQTLSRKNR